MNLSTSVHCWRHLSAIGFVVWLAVGPLQAQQQGTLRLRHWPASEEALRQVVGDASGPWSRIEVLPFLDSLVLGYHYTIAGDTVYAGFTLDWHPATWGWFRGRRVLWDEMPEGVKLQTMQVRLRFAAGGRPVAEWPVRFDSLALGPWPERFESATYAFPVAEVFGMEAADSLQAWQTAGLAPDSLLLDWIAFVVERAGRPVAHAIVRRRPGPPYIDVIFDPEVMVVQGAGKRGGSVVTRRPRRIGRSADGTQAREGRRSGRSSGRGWFRGGEQDDEEHEEDKDETLLPAALAGVAAVALVAVAGGGFGYSGNLKRTPIGVAGGVLRADWGLLLQVSMNEAVLERSRSAPEELAVRLLGFSGWVASGVQPGLALGMRWREYRGERETQPVIGPALVFRADPVVLIGGVDLVGGGPELGVVLNLRQLLGY